MIGELLSEVGGRVGHGLVLAWFESYVLRLVFLDSSLQSPGQEKHFGILFVPLRIVVREIHICRDDNGGNGSAMAWFESYVLRLVFLDSSLQLPGQEKHFGILFVPLRVVVREIHL